MRSVAVIANSPSEARRITDLYQVEPSRLIELPFVPSLAVRSRTTQQQVWSAEAIRLKYGLPERYVFYPAFYLFHKNHLYLFEALVELGRRHRIDFHAVLCGGDPSGQRSTIETQARTLGVSDRTHFLSFVPEEDISALYAGAFATVSPSPFGPANLQPLEAAASGCPVVCADLPGSREQMNDAALYCDLSDPSSLADHLAALIEQPVLRDRLTKNGYRLVEDLMKVDYGERLSPTFQKFAYIRRRWAWPDHHI
jgi:glycosyltransferase involved in cell wall biosynthesis